MPKYEKKIAKKPEVEQKHRASQNDNRISAKQFHGGRQNSIHKSDTPFYPSVTQHLEMLSEANSAEERATVTSYLQRSYGNRYVQRLVTSINNQTAAGANKAEVQRKPEEEEEELLQGKSILQRQNLAESPEYAWRGPDAPEWYEYNRLLKIVREKFPDMAMEVLEQDEFGLPSHWQITLIPGTNPKELTRENVLNWMAHSTGESVRPPPESSESQSGAPQLPTGFETPVMEKHSEQGINRGLSESGAGEPRTNLVSYSQQSYVNRDIQPKLTVSDPGDRYEQEADKVAKTITRNIQTQVSRQPMPEEEEEEIQSKPLLQCQPEEDEEEEETIQAKPTGNASVVVSQELEGSINASRGNGHPLADNIRDPMEKAFGADFSAVHVHTDPKADALNKELSAKAFTTGQDIFFREGEYSPGSGSGQELIAHELTHVVQQSGKTIERKDDIKYKSNPKAAFNATTDTSEALIQQKETGEPKEPSIPIPKTSGITVTRPIPPATTTAPTTPPRTTKPTARARLREATKPSKPLPRIPTKEGPATPEKPLAPALKHKIFIAIDELVDHRASDIGAHIDTLPPREKVDEAAVHGQQIQQEANQAVERQSGPPRELMEELVVEQVPPPEKVEPGVKGGAIAPAGGGTSDIAGKLAEGRDWVHTTADFVMEGLQAGMVGSQKVLNILGHISGAIGIFFTTIMSYLDIRAIFRSIKRMWDLNTILNESEKQVKAQGKIEPDEQEFIAAIKYAYKQKLTKVIRKVFTLTAGLIAAGTGIAFWAAGGIAAAANAWNPVGWGIAVGLLAVGVGIALGVLGHKIYRWIKKRKKRGQERTMWATKIFEQGIAPGGRLKSKAQKAIDSLKIRKATGFLGTLKSFFWKGKGDVITAAEMEQAYNQAENKEAAKAKFVKGIAGKLSST